MAKQNWKPGNMLYPVPVVMVSSKKKGENERPNIVTVAWAGTICSDPVMLSRTLMLLDRALKTVGLYRLGCNTEKEAARISYLGMKG